MGRTVDKPVWSLSNINDRTVDNARLGGVFLTLMSELLIIVGRLPLTLMPELLLIEQVGF